MNDEKDFFFFEGGFDRVSYERRETARRNPDSQTSHRKTSNRKNGVVVVGGTILEPSSSSSWFSGSFWNHIGTISGGGLFA